MVKLLKQSRYLAISRKTRGQRWTTKAQRTRTRSMAFKTKYQASDRMKDNIFWKPKEDRTYGERVDDCLEAGYRGSLKRLERRSQDVANGTT